MSPIIPLTEFFRSLDLRNLATQGVVRRRGVECLNSSMRRRFVHGHVKDAEMQLAQIEQCVVDVFGANQTVDNIIGDSLLHLLARGLLVFRQSRVMPTQRFQLRRRPAPVLKHLARRLDKVAHCIRTVETRICSLGNEVVDSMAQFVEERDDFVVFQETRFFGGGFGEIADQRCCRISPFSVYFEALPNH